MDNLSNTASDSPPKHDVSVSGLYILDVLGRPVTAIPERGNVDFIGEIRLTVAGTAGAVVVDCVRFGLSSLAVGDDEKTDFVIDRMARLGVDTSAMQRIDGVPTTKTPDDCAAFYLDRGVRCCVFTSGGEGAFHAHADGTRLRMPAFDIEVVDATGCGDAFDAGFITALHRGKDPEESIRFAQAAVGFVATGLGSDAGIASFEDTVAKAGSWGQRG